jgi:hypothetical protein
VPGRIFVKCYPLLNAPQERPETVASAQLRTLFSTQTMTVVRYVIGRCVMQNLLRKPFPLAYRVRAGVVDVISEYSAGWTRTAGQIARAYVCANRGLCGGKRQTKGEYQSLR